jgi:hypothetical protein
MTDDITRGLSLLADEARPPAVDVDAVIAAATARTRGRRAVVATAVATVATLGALAGTLGTADDASPPVGRGTTTTSPIGGDNAAAGEDAGPVGEVPRLASAEEQAVRAPRLQSELIAAFDRILPSGWVHSTFAFGCTEYGCWAEGDLIDDVGTIRLRMSVSGGHQRPSCMTPPDCADEDEAVLDDGTYVRLATTEDDGASSEERRTQKAVWSGRTDGTSVYFTVDWPASRAAPAVTDAGWMAFGKALTY